MLTAVTIGRCRLCRGIIIKDPIAVCPNCRLGHWGDRRYYITPLEARVAFAIAAGCGRNVHVNEIIDWLWGDDADGGPDDASHAVRSAVCRLKLYHGADWIENEHGFGYRLISLRSASTRHSGQMTESGGRTHAAVA